MSRQSFAPYRRVVAMICVALAVMLSGQAYISLMDRIDHSNRHAHFANPLAGDVQYSTADRDSSGHHHHHGMQDVADNHTHGSGGHHHTHDPADH